MKYDGWIPIRLVGNQFVDWCWLGSDRFTEPFFDGTIEIALRRPFNTLFTHRTPMAELGSWYKASPGMIPTGFIFHMSRCGSTLVSQMLAALPANVVISEAGPLERLARAVSIAEETRVEWLHWMVSALGQKRAGNETRYFIKFDSVTILALPVIRRAFPSVPWIFLYRDPTEVLASHLRQPAAAMSPGIVCDVSVIDARMEEVVSMLPAEYSARAIGRICECAVQGMDERGMLVNYTELPQAAWAGIARHFGVDFSPDELERMQAVALRDAKQPRRKFEADGESKRLEISDAARSAAARWISPRLYELEALRNAKTASTP